MLIKLLCSLSGCLYDAFISVLARHHVASVCLATPRLHHGCVSFKSFGCYSSGSCKKEVAFASSALPPRHVAQGTGIMWGREQTPVSPQQSPGDTAHPGHNPNHPALPESSLMGLLWTKRKQKQLFCVCVRENVLTLRTVLTSLELGINAIYYSEKMKVSLVWWYWAVFQALCLGKHWVLGVWIVTNWILPF